MDRRIEPIDPIEDYDAKGEEKMAEINSHKEAIESFFTENK